MPERTGRRERWYCGTCQGYVWTVYGPPTQAHGSASVEREIRCAVCQRLVGTESTNLEPPPASTAQPADDA